MTGWGRITTSWCTIAGAAMVLLVLGAYWPGRLPGASAGAEVLLVAAGALMAQLLLVERDRPLGAVVATGARLAVPPLLVLVATGIAVQRLVDLREWAGPLRDVRDAAIGIVNLGPIDEASPVAGFWIIALLAQSAVLLLLLRPLVSRWRTRAGLALVAVLTAASFGWWVVGGDDLAAARFWPVGCGVLVALLAGRWPLPSGPVAAAAGWLGALGLGAVALVGPVPRLEVLAGVAAGVVLVATARSSTSPGGLLRGRTATWFAWLAWAGFCWAWPALSLAPEAADRDLGLRDRAGLLVVVGVVALLTWALVAGVRSVVRHGVAWAALAAACLLAAVLVTVPGSERLDAIETDAARTEALLTADLPECFGALTMAARAEGRDCRNGELEGVLHPPLDRAGADFEAYLDCWSRPDDANLNLCDLGGPAQGPRVLVLGDSHARVLLGAFRRLAEHGVMEVTAAAKASCAWSTLPVRDSKDPLRGPLCDQWRVKLTTWLEQHVDEYDVIVTTAYAGRMKGSESAQVRGLVEAWEPAARAGVPIVALRDNPRLPGDTLECLSGTEPDDWARCDVARDDIVPDFDPFEPAAARVDGAHFVDTWPFFCREDVCPAVIGGVNVFRDYNHVSATYAGTLAAPLHREIARTGVLDAVHRSAAG
ncbi:MULTISPECIES: SGNH hydrolase domain-containing protein [Aeromicrobium]|uniref:SGNH hydrolase domain-containing protein n=1 Tax=Aeromicrobium TaxID=2040 RepID=UPI00210D531A|nr:SGNH hydrolase domain-containing protein [Aeromicrobium sp. 636]